MVGASGRFGGFEVTPKRWRCGELEAVGSCWREQRLMMVGFLEMVDCTGDDGKIGSE